MSFSFVIPTYNHYDLLHQLLWDMYKNCSLPDEVIVVNNGSVDDTATLNGLEWWIKSKMLPIRVLDLEENIGFLRASNAGLRYATGDIVCLISNDVRLYGDLMKSVDIVDRTSDKWFAGGRLFWNSTGWNDFDGKVFPYLEGWLLVGKKDAWKDVGYFDESFAPNDFEDVDFSTSLLSKKYVLHALELDCKMEHIGAQTIGYNPERQALTERNREKFRQKWVK